MQQMSLFGTSALALFLLSGPVVGQEPPSADQKEQPVQVKKQGLFRLDGIYVGPGYTRYRYAGRFGYSHFRPYFYPALYPYPSDYAVGPWVHRGYGSGFDRTAGTGRIKLKTGHKDASVFLDGAFAGVAGDLKHIWLQPGVYQLRVEAAQQQPFEQKVYVLTGKTLKINADLPKN